MAADRRPRKDCSLTQRTLAIVHADFGQDEEAGKLLACPDKNWRAARTALVPIGSQIVSSELPQPLRVWFLCADLTRHVPVHADQGLRLVEPDQTDTNV